MSREVDSPTKARGPLGMLARVALAMSGAIAIVVAGRIRAGNPIDREGGGSQAPTHIAIGLGVAGVIMVAIAFLDWFRSSERLPAHLRLLAVGLVLIGFVYGIAHEIRY